MTVAWLSYFPVEWLDDVPDEVSRLPRQHPATWQRVLLSALEAIPGLKLHVLVLRKEFQRNLTFVRHGVTFHLIKTIGGLRSSSLFWHDTLLLRKRVKAIKPDVVHAWGTESGAAAVAARLRFPSVVTVQGLATWNAEVFSVPPYERLAAWIERWYLRRCRVVTAESTFSSNYVAQLAPAVEVQHVDTVPDEIFHQVVRRPPPGRVRLLFSGQLGPRKGGDLLVQALHQLRDELDFELVVVGGADPEFLREMKGITAPEVWSRISFRTNLQPSEVVEELAQATLFVAPTRADTGPTAVKEAVVAGVPVVGSNLGGLPDYVIPDKTGILVKPGDAAELAQALRMALRHPLFGVGRVDAAALEEQRRRLAPARMAAEFLRVYKLAIQRFRH